MCDVWAREGGCQGNPDYVLTHCPVACGVWYRLSGAERSSGTLKELEDMFVANWPMEDVTEDGAVG